MFCEIFFFDSHSSIIWEITLCGLPYFENKYSNIFFEPSIFSVAKRSIGGKDPLINCDFPKSDFILLLSISYSLTHRGQVFSETFGRARGLDKFLLTNSASRSLSLFSFSNFSIRALIFSVREFRFSLLIG